MKSDEFFVSEKRKQVWKVDLELIEVFKSICARHNLRYFADGGTLLGVIRHKGFIPWDDDVDITMLREDYDRFISIAKKELKPPYFLQIPETEEDYFYGHAKIRKDNTTAIRYVQYPEKYKHHQGIFIDIFPIDNIPDNRIAHKIHRFIAVKLMQFIYYAIYHYSINEHSTVTNIKHKISKMLLPSNKAIRKMFKIYERWIRRPNKKITKRVGTTSMYYYMGDATTWPREWFDKVIIKRFENIDICIPAEYDGILKKYYGEYMVPVIGDNQHGEVFFDLDHDYSEYYNGTRSFTKDDLVL